MRIPLTLLTLLLLGGSSFAQQRHLRKSPASAPPVERFTNTELRNSEVVVRRLSIPPGESATISASIHDYLVVAYAPSSLTVSGYQTNFEMNLTDGEIQVLQGGWPHTIKNQSQQTAQFIAVEVLQNISAKTALCGLGAKNCYQTRFGKSAQGEYQQALLFETDSAALYRAQLGPGVPMHQHGDNRKHLIIAVTPIQGNLDEQTFSLKAGETLWHPGSFDEIVNESSSSATMLILELK
jgi:hypothetical protein